MNAQTPLQRGDVIVAVNNERFASLQEFNGRIAKAQPGGSLALLIRRSEASLFVPVKVAPP